MAVTEPGKPADRVTFWFGCNMLRHADMIRISMLLLEKVGYDVEAVGGPAWCCGTAHDHAPHAASTMAGRTVERFNARAREEDRGTVVTWCPSCHMHMHDIMAPGNPIGFEVAHVTELIAARADRLVPLMTTPVNETMLLHRHHGFAATHVPVNDKVAAMLSKVPGLAIVEGPQAAGHMCSSLAPVAGALAATAKATWEAAAAAGASTVITVFHSCHRELAAYSGRAGIGIVNWVHVVARAMGITTSDTYLGWRQGGAPDIGAIEKAGSANYQRLVEPELRKPLKTGA